MSLLVDARSLADYISLLDGFVIRPSLIRGYDHMGALLTDAVLQAGVNYRTVVQPRVSAILSNYPEATTTTAFRTLMIYYGANIILRWKHPEKPRRLQEITDYFYDKHVETPYDLHHWLLSSENCGSLRQVRGVGPKTVDYLKSLANLPTVAVDRHIRRFVMIAGLDLHKYEEVRTVVSYAADLLSVPRCSLDYAIWSYSSRELTAEPPHHI